MGLRWHCVRATQCSVRFSIKSAQGRAILRRTCFVSVTPPAASWRPWKSRCRGRINKGARWRTGFGEGWVRRRAAWNISLPTRRGRRGIPQEPKRRSSRQTLDVPVRCQQGTGEHPTCQFGRSEGPQRSSRTGIAGTSPSHVSMDAVASWQGFPSEPARGLGRSFESSSPPPGPWAVRTRRGCHPPKFSFFPASPDVQGVFQSDTMAPVRRSLAGRDPAGPARFDAVGGDPLGVAGLDGAVAFRPGRRSQNL